MLMPWQPLRYSPEGNLWMDICEQFSQSPDSETRRTKAVINIFEDIHCPTHCAKVLWLQKNSCPDMDWHRLYRMRTYRRVHQRLFEDFVMYRKTPVLHVRGENTYLGRCPGRYCRTSQNLHRPTFIQVGRDKTYSLFWHGIPTVPGFVAHHETFEETLYRYFFESLYIPDNKSLSSNMLYMFLSLSRGRKGVIHLASYSAANCDVQRKPSRIDSERSPEN